jgi:hypothetical protein
MGGGSPCETILKLSDAFIFLPRFSSKTFFEVKAAIRAANCDARFGGQSLSVGLKAKTNNERAREV